MGNKALQCMLVLGVAVLLGTTLAAGCTPDSPVADPPPEEPGVQDKVDAVAPDPSPDSAGDTAGDDPPEIPRIGVEEVKQKLDAGASMVIVDTRSASAYEGAHIAGAVSLPLEDMEEPYDGLDGYQEIITYCT
jgi:hypothetical protein